MRTLLASALLALTTGAAIAATEAPQKLEPIPEPPSLGDSSMEPDVTIRQRGSEKVEEYRIKGRLYMVKVTPRVGPPYYLINRTPDGQWYRYNGNGDNLVVPEWVIMTW